MKKLIAGNWKMNKAGAESEKLALSLKELLKKPKCDVAVCVPFTAIERVKRILNGTMIELGAQNIAWADKGAFTGEISADMLIDAGAAYVIVGHSERRAMFGETDETVNKRAAQALKNKLTPIICVGETMNERESEKTEAVLSIQIKGAFKGMSAAEAERCVVAYEPVWAIGTGLTATNEQANGAIAYIRGVLDSLLGVGKKIRILYGGSMNAKNAEELLKMPDIDGGLIGGASLIAEDFALIVQAAGK